MHFFFVDECSEKRGTISRRAEPPNYKRKKEKEKRRPKISKAAGNKPLFSRVGLDYKSLTPLNPNGLLPRTDARRCLSMTKWFQLEIFLICKPP